MDGTSIELISEMFSQELYGHDKFMAGQRASKWSLVMILNLNQIIQVI